MGGQDMGHRKGDDAVREAAEYTFGCLQVSFRLLNAFASGETQRAYVRVEPLGVLAQVYGDLAPAYQRLQEVLKR